jgi:hypothetical protein
MKMEQTECSETSAYEIQAPGNCPEESIQHSEHGESLKSRDFRSSGTLHIVDWCFVTDVSGQPICSIFNGEALGSYKCTLLNLLEEQISHVDVFLFN